MLSYHWSVSGFQSLIGSIKSRVSSLAKIKKNCFNPLQVLSKEQLHNDIYSDLLMFQSLIGSIKSWHNNRQVIAVKVVSIPYRFYQKKCQNNFAVLISTVSIPYRFYQKLQIQYPLRPQSQGFNPLQVLSKVLTVMMMMVVGSVSIPYRFYQKSMKVPTMYVGKDSFNPLQVLSKVHDSLISAREHLQFQSLIGSIKSCFVIHL